MNESQEIRTIASRLREERVRADLTQPALALIGGVSKTTQSGYESAIHTPNALYLSRIDRHGIDATYIVTGQRPGVRAGAELDWNLVSELLAVLTSFNRQSAMPLDISSTARILRVLYAATVASGRIDPALVSAVLAEAA